jgi:hypothetical protein
VDFITQANCMTLNVEAISIDLSRPQLLLVRFVSCGSILIGPVPYLTPKSKFQRPVDKAVSRIIQRVCCGEGVRP